MLKVQASLFRDIFGCRPHHVSNMTCKARDLHEGVIGGKPGAVLCWKCAPKAIDPAKTSKIDALPADSSYSRTIRQED
ncbi:hypothetical protein WN944_011510 [Citrus x changshan-huyou]|uniref:Uncharacterized protein n=1 Tax=Citrus x changshan-huyou TaxID=2935761 RepID=A0AAP0MYF9_9ROSI